MKHVLLINAALTSLLLRATDAGSTHDQRMAAATPYPLLAGGRWLQALGFLAFTLDEVEIMMPTRSREAGLSRGRRKPRIDASPVGACASSPSTAASSAVASCTTPAASGRRVSVTWLWKSAVDCITFACG